MPLDSRALSLDRLVRLDRRARADQVAIAVRVVDPRRRSARTCSPARTAAETPPARASTDASSRRRRPRRRCAARSSGRCPSDRPVPSMTAWISRADRDHRVAEAIELVLRLALGRLDHQRARRPGTTPSARGSRSPSAASRRPARRSMPARLLERPQVEDHLVRDAAVRAACRARGSAARAAP